MDNGAKQSMQNTIKTLQAKSQNIEKMLEKGSDVLIFQLGSHSYKFNYANQKNPFRIRNLIGFRRKKSQNKEQQMHSNPEFENCFEDLQKTLKKQGIIREQNRSYKGKPKSKMEIRFDYDIDQESEIIFDSQIYTIGNCSEFKIIQPIKYSHLNVSKQFSITDICQFIEKIIRYALKQKMNITQQKFSSLSVVLVLPNHFNRQQIKEIVKIFLNQMGFNSLYLHLNSILSCFRLCCAHACVVDIGYEKISVCCVDQGVILPGTLVVKNYGLKNLDQAYLFKINERYGTKNKCKLSVKNYGHMKQVEKLRQIICMYGNIEQVGNRTYQLSFMKGNAIEVLTMSFNQMFTMVPYVLFYQQPLRLLISYDEIQDKQYFDYNSQYFDIYYDEEDHFEEISGGGNPYPHLPKEQFKFFNQNVIDSYHVNTLQEIVCYSICCLKDHQLRKRFANNILIIGGGGNIPGLSQHLQKACMQKFKQYQTFIDRMEFVDKKDNLLDSLAWSGGTIIPNLQSMKDLWIYKGRFNGNSLDQIQQEENVSTLDKRVIKKQKKKQWGMRYLKQKVPFQW